jgi:glycosyltransferase involved in cell wall biosynthesis
MHELSVIIPMHNGVNFIDRAILSIEEVSSSIEIIVVENGSSDGSFEHVRQTYPDIQVVEILEHSQSLARNAGADSAKFSVITFLDQDDEFLSPRNTAKYIEAAFNGEIVIGTQLYLESEFASMPNYLQRNPNSHLPHYYPNGMLISKKVFIESGGFKAEYDSSEDIEFLARLQRDGFKIRYVTDNFLIRHFHETNISHRIEEAQSGLFRVLRGHLRAKTENE